MRDGQGTLRRDISTALVGLYKEHFGKGPTRCRTYLEPNLVVVILGQGYTASEQTLFEAGKWYEVRSGPADLAGQHAGALRHHDREAERAQGLGLHERRTATIPIRGGAVLLEPEAH